MYESRSTAEAYQYALNKFFGCIGVGADEYFEGARNYEEDVKTFFSSIEERPPKTIRLMLSAMRVFLEENDVELPAKFWRRLGGRKKEARALTLDKVLSNLELRRILAHMNVKGKAFYLTLASSGMRIGEALSEEEAKKVIECARNAST